MPDLEAASYHSCAEDNSIRSLQARPLPDAPAVVAGVRNSGSFTDQFHSVASTLDRTLVDSQQNRVRPGGDDEEEATLAESIVDSMHSCADTFQTGEDATLHTCADTIEGDDDMNSLRDFDSPTPPASVGKSHPTFTIYLSSCTIFQHKPIFLLFYTIPCYLIFYR